MRGPLFVPQIPDAHSQSRKLVLFKKDIGGFLADLDADMFPTLSRFGYLIPADRNGLSLTLNINADSTFIRPTVRNPVIFNKISMGTTPFVWFVTESDPDLPTALDTIVSDDIIGISMSYGDAVLTVIENLVVLCGPVFDTPAEEKPQSIAFEVVIVHDGALGSGARMQSQIRIVHAPAIRYSYVVADLP